MKKRTYIYKRFERFWHWMQVLLIGLLTLTGFEIHSSYNLFGYAEAVRLHDIAAWSFAVLIIFTIFWHFSVGAWKQYIPSTKLLKAQFEYYISGIFKGAPHPTKKTSYDKFNPLQRLTYLGFKVFIIPIQVISGFIYMFYGDLMIGSLEVMAYIHTLFAFGLIAFVIAHVYLISTSDEPIASLAAMITGWEEVDIDPKEEHRRHMQRAVDKSIAGYYRLDARGKFLDVNAAWLKMYKCVDLKNVVGKHYSFTRTEDDIQELNSIFKRVMGGETVIGIPVVRKCKDGSIGRHILSMNPTFQAGEIIGVEGFIIDIEDLDSMKRPMSYTIRNSNAGYYRLNKGGYYEELNDAWLKMYKCENKDNIMGKHYSMSRSKEDLVRLDEIFKQVTEIGETITSEVARRRCKDGSIGKHILSANPVYDGTEIIGMEGFILDISSLDEEKIAVDK